MVTTPYDYASGVSRSFRVKKNLNLNNLIDQLSHVFRSVPDKRRAARCSYQQHDVMMAAVSCMFFQEPSWLQYQKQLQDECGSNNLSQLFHVKKIPQESQVRQILDQIDSEQYRLVFKRLFELAREDKQLESYRIPLTSKGLFYISMDGTIYHTSKKICCKRCLRKSFGKEQTYQHHVLQGALMHPDKKAVIPLMPEPIQNEDGQKKQDCEHEAAKRFLSKLKKDHPRLSILLGGDGLFSDGGMIKQAQALGFHFLFVCKLGDHKYLKEWLAGYKDWQWFEHTDKKGVTHRYRWQNKVPLSGKLDAPDVNYIEYEQVSIKGKVTYRNNWVTDLDINYGNAWRLIRTGRSRWKIENDCFNTLKNQGYHLGHNFGHGEANLSHNMYISTLIAFLLHQFLELCDEAYQQCRKKFGSKRHLWEQLRNRLYIVVVPDWYWLFDWCLNPDGKIEELIKSKA